MSITHYSALRSSILSDDVSALSKYISEKKIQIHEIGTMELRLEKTQNRQNFTIQPNGVDPLRFCCIHDSIKCLSFLIKAGLDPLAQTPTRDRIDLYQIRMRNRIRLSPLDLAAIYDSPNVLTYYLTYHNVDSASFVSYAAEYGSLKCIEVLLSFGFDILPFIVKLFSFPVDPSESGLYKKLVASAISGCGITLDTETLYQVFYEIAKFDNDSLVSYILEMAKPFLRQSKFLDDAFLKLCKYGRFEHVKSMMDKGFTPSLSMSHELYESVFKSLSLPLVKFFISWHRKDIPLYVLCHLKKSDETLSFIKGVISLVIDNKLSVDFKYDKFSFWFQLMLIYCDPPLLEIMLETGCKITQDEYEKCKVILEDNPGCLYIVDQYYQKQMNSK